MQLKRLQLLACLLLTAGLTSIGQTPDAPWPFYGHDAGGGRYAALRQINDSNVSRLKVAWIYRTGELKTYEGTRIIEKAAFEATPIMIGGILYFSTPSCRVMAVDAASGKEKGVFDPRVSLHRDYSEVSSRGVSAWPAASTPQRIFVATIDGRLIALDAGTGQLIPSFGNAGVVDLDGLGEDIAETSPPAVIGDLGLPNI